MGYILFKWILFGTYSKSWYIGMTEFLKTDIFGGTCMQKKDSQNDEIKREQEQSKKELLKMIRNEQYVQRLKRIRTPLLSLIFVVFLTGIFAVLGYVDYLVMNVLNLILLSLSLYLMFAFMKTKPKGKMFAFGIVAIVFNILVLLATMLSIYINVIGYL